ncbi:MAG: DUF4404 family protein [Verrucomicrobia bacterium]|nr:DUF4404 family protein [Verrucomicrobiota bacterium]
MHDQTLDQIEGRIRNSESLSNDRRLELLALVETLRGEIVELTKTHKEDARAIVVFADASMREATRAEQDPELLDVSLKGFGSSVVGFEESHPRLVQIVNSISQNLSNLGI